MTAADTIQFLDVQKTFKTDFWKPQTQVVKGISFSITKSRVCGLIGPNGAGKTTLIKILMGLLKPTSGSVNVFGHDPHTFKDQGRVGYLPERTYYYEYLTSLEVLDFYGRLFSLSQQERRTRSESLLKLVGLEGQETKKLSAYSKGMLQRIGIAQALLNDPELVVFDEPMSGLDPLGRKDVKDIVLRLKHEGKTVLLASHILADVESLCDDVVFLLDGNVEASGPISDMIMPEVDSVDVYFEHSSPEELLAPMLGDGVLAKTGSRQRFRLDKPAALQTLLDLLVKGSAHVFSVEPHKPSLEEFMVERVHQRRDGTENEKGAVSS